LAYEKKETVLHRPVLLREVIRYLAPTRGGWYLDCTLGGGGHAHAIADHLGENGTLLAIDIDSALVEQGVRAFVAEENVIVRKENYKNSGAIMQELGVDGFNGIVLDLGFSSYHIASPGRGFSFGDDDSLDMRYDPEGGGIMAEEVLSRYPEENIREILYQCGEEWQAGKIAAKIVSKRKEEKIQTAAQLGRIVAEAKGSKGKKAKTDAATKTFQALRIYVNRELENLEQFLVDLPRILNAGGRAAVISYHSLEDRLVKRYFKKYSGKCVCPPGLPACACGKERIFRILTSKPLRPSLEEISINPRARSARMRVAQKGGTV
jgi:16S rRNA (cytosine1402-N4)-methyltransferase